MKTFVAVSSAVRSGSAVAFVAAALALGACGGATSPEAGQGAAAPSGAATAAVPPGAAGVSAEQGEGEEHRHGHHGGGVVALIAMSIKDLDLSADQKTAVEKIRADLVAKMAPARAAGQALNAVLADGVAAGAVDRAKADAAIDQIVAQATAIHGATLDAMNQLHAALTPAQRAALVDKLQQHFENWKEANGHEEQEGQPHRSGHLLALVKDLQLSQAEAQQIKTSYHDLLKASAPAGGGAPAAGAAPGSAAGTNLQDHQHKEVTDHLQAFATAFKAATFDAHSLTTANAANGHMARWGATRMARFVEAAAPVLTPDQRTKFAQQLRDRGAKQSS